MKEGKQPLKPRRFLRFSLRALLLTTSAIAVWLGMQVHKAHKQRAAVAAVEALGGVALYGGTIPEESAVADYLGRDYTDNVTIVDLNDSRAADDDLALLKYLPHTQWLTLTDRPITDTGIEHLRPLKNLTVLLINGTAVTDSGLNLSEKIPSLQFILVERTWVSARRVADFQQSRPDVEIISNYEDWQLQSASRAAEREAGVDNE